MNLTITPYKENFSIYKPQNQVHFGGIPIKPVVGKDILEISPATAIFNQHIDTIMAKIQDKTHFFSPEKLENIINSAKINFPNFKEEEILTTMQRSTQWADYTCMNRIATQLKLGAIQEGTPINNCFNYFQHFKKLFPTDYLAPQIMLVTENELPLIQRIKN